MQININILLREGKANKTTNLPREDEIRVGEKWLDMLAGQYVELITVR